MTTWAVFDAQGRILRLLRVPPAPEDAAVEDVLGPLAEGEDAVEVDPSVSDDTHRIVGGEAVALPPKPGPRHEWDYALGQWRDTTPPGRDAALARARRDALLVESDRTQLPDYPLTPEQRTQWATYRAALRAVPSQPGFPGAIDWPTPPA